MILKHFYIALDPKDFTDRTIISDFNFQTDYMTQFIEKKLIRQKFETTNFNMLMIRLRTSPNENVFIEETYKCMTIEIPFENQRYKEIYPNRNEYPLNGKLLKPIEKTEEFNEFLMGIIIHALKKAKEQNVILPYDFLINTVLDFKLNGFNNEWVYKTKIFKKYDFKISLFCKLTMNYFSLNLMIEKNKRKIYEKEILKTLPSSIQYKDEFKDIECQNEEIVVTKNTFGNPILFSLPISKIN